MYFGACVIINITESKTDWKKNKISEGERKEESASEEGGSEREREREREREGNRREGPNEFGRGVEGS